MFTVFRELDKTYAFFLICCFFVFFPKVTDLGQENTGKSTLVLSSNEIKYLTFLFFLLGAMTSPLYSWETYGKDPLLYMNRIICILRFSDRTLGCSYMQVSGTTVGHHTLRFT